MDFWEAVLAVIVALAIWKVASGLWGTTAADRAEFKIAAERDEAEAEWGALPEAEKERQLEEARKRLAEYRKQKP